MDRLSRLGQALRRRAEWVAARPYAVFIAAALALGVASIIITLPPELR